MVQMDQVREDMISKMSLLNNAVLMQVLIGEPFLTLMLIIFETWVSQDLAFLKFVLPKLSL